MVEDKVPEVVVGSLCLGHLVVRLALASVDNVGELHGVLDEEDGNVVANDVPVTLLGVKLDSKPSNITDGVSTASASQDSGEAEEDRRLAGGVSQDGSVGEVLKTLKDSELSKGASSTCVNNTLRDTLMVKAVNLTMG